MRRHLFKGKNMSGHTGLAKIVSATLLLCSLIFLLCGCNNGASVRDDSDSAVSSDAGMSDSGDIMDQHVNNDNVDAAPDSSESPDGKNDARTDDVDDTAAAAPGTSIFVEPDPDDYETVYETGANADIPLYINEILPVNTSTLKHNGGYYDAVEILNASDTVVNLADYCLSDSKWHRTDYVLPAVELQPGEMTVVYCTGKYNQKDDCDMPFELSYFGEKIYLCDLKGNIIDKVDYPVLPRDVSYSRNTDGTFNYCVLPTIGSSNKGGYSARAQEPAVSVATGFYQGGQKVSFTSEGEIHYTLDGTAPTYESPVWNGKEISIDKTCSLRAFAHVDGCLDSFTQTFNYYINEPDYELGVLKVSMRPSDFGTMSENYRSNRKYSANATLFENGRQQFTIDCAISMFGCTSREYDKKSYQLTFTTAYGPSKLKYKVFDNLDIDTFNSLVLRSGSQDNESAMMRDEFVSSLFASEGVVTNVLVQAYRPVNLYVNDEYRGVYFIREHIDEHMIASHCGCDPEQVTLLEQGIEVKSGTEAAEWKKMWQFLKDNGPIDAEDYEYLSGIVNLESVADYYIIQIWCANHDLDNVREFKVAGDKWKYILYDLDLTMTSKADNSVKYTIGTLNTGLPRFNALVYRLLENKDFQKLFLDRLKLLTSTVLSEDYACNHLDEMAEVLKHDMKYNCERWQGRDSSGKVGYRTYKGWEESVAYLRSLIAGRNDIIIRDFCNMKGIDPEGE